MALLVVLLLLVPPALAEGSHVGHGGGTYEHNERAISSEDYMCPNLSLALVLVGNDLRWTMGGGSPATACQPDRDYPTTVAIPPASLQGSVASGYWARGVTDCASWAFTLEPLGHASALRYAVHDKCDGDARNTLLAVVAF
jgi:hypothetical protein